MIKYRNLAPSLKDSIYSGVPEIGKIVWLVDSDYRTRAQGWSKSDGTGPLDLLYEKDQGYIYRTGDYSSDYLAVQAGIDQMVDFRGDTLAFTPGNYSISTALAINVPDARWVGPPVGDPRICRATITAAVANALTTTAAADRMEVGYLKFIPLTAASIWSAVANTDNLWVHNFYYDTNGIAASTATIFLTGAGTTNDHFKFSNFYALTDGAQGPLLSMTGTYVDLTISDFTWDHEAGTLATCLLLDNSAGDAGGPGPVLIKNGRGNLAAGATAVTNLVALTDAGTNIQWITINGWRASIPFCTSAALISLSAGTGNTAEAAETGIADCYIDVVGAGAGGAGTAYTQ